MRKTTLLSVCLPLLFANVLPSIADNGKSLEIEGVTRIDQAGKTVMGKVTDANGEPLIGVTIFLKGNPGKGTITDIDGKYTISVPAGEELVFSSIGYVKQTLAVNSGTLDVVMKEDTQKLDEVVVVGYGTTTKRSMIASVSSVDSEELTTLPIANMSKGLAGRAPGLIVKTSGGGINNKAQISIRGGSTPLVVIDGVIRNYDDFIQMPSEDIESLSLLKDASATAVYGSRAADGIIQITTKKGKSGKAYIEYNFNMSMAEPAYWKERLDSWDRAEYANIAKRNDGLPDSFSAERIQKMRDGSDPLQNNNTNYRDLVLRRFAPQSSHGIRMTGGTEANNYYVSLNHLDQESLFKNNNYNMQRTNFRLSQSSLIKSIGLKTTATLDGYLQKETEPYSSRCEDIWAYFSHIQNSTPLLPAVNKYGLPYDSPGNSVVELAKDNGYKNKDEKTVNGNLKLEWAVPWVKGLNLSATGNYRYGLTTYKQWRKDAAAYDWDSKEPKYAGLPMLYNKTDYGYTWTTQFFANYTNTFGKHTISALAGYEATYGYSNSYWLQRENYKFPIDQINVGPEDTQKNGGSESEAGRAGWVGQVKYNYDNKYFVEGSLRYDGSDNFPADRRWGTFFSASLGWSIADEAFMESLVEKNIFNQLKLRASYGQVGLDNWGDENNPFHIGRFEYLTSYSLNNKAYVLNGAYVPGFSEGGIPSPDISWFTTDQFDAGFDFSSLNNRLYGSVDYFFYKTHGFLYAPNQVDVGYTDPLGMSLPRISTNGEHRRAGFDLSLGWRDHVGDFTYDITANMTRFDQLWAFDPSESVSNVMNPYKRSSQQKGYYGNLYRNLGFYTDANDVLNSVKRLGSYDLTAGDLKYADFNGDGKIDDSDMVRSGKNSFPRMNYGINIKLGYKGFFLNMLFQGASRFDMYISGTAAMNGGQTGEFPVIYDYQTDYWRPDNTDARYPRLMSSAGLNGNNNYEASDFWLVNGAFLRMKDFSFGYDFKRLLKNVNWISKANLAISGQNLFTISEAIKYGLDPEESSTERYGYPNERIYAVSLSVGF
ncbi:SusC/RagA family TonB-linked outer membrane protein [Parabacteroides chongii]|uniref:SusC/RagA family TonB-linked outer membrane protein n=1 Tax=Parabacteroides chongii TaxID=2685834 RepID=UPI00240D0029|nr:TonB-dependent receptor [Parabacteroides chongii]WFE87038.1 TonB-dependent receptor [Parabacteroides chongii]